MRKYPPGVLLINRDSHYLNESQVCEIVNQFDCPLDPVLETPVPCFDVVTWLRRIAGCTDVELLLGSVFVVTRRIRLSHCAGDAVALIADHDLSGEVKRRKTGNLSARSTELLVSTPRAAVSYVIS